MLSASAASAAVSSDAPRPWLAACAVSDAVDLTTTPVADRGELPWKWKPARVAAAGALGVRTQ